MRYEVRDNYNCLRWNTTCRETALEVARLNGWTPILVIDSEFE